MKRWLRPRVAGVTLILLASGVLTAAAPGAWLAGLLLALTGAWIAGRLPALGAVSFERLAAAALLVPVALGLLIPAMVGWVATARGVVAQLSKVDPDGTWILFAGVLGVLALFVQAAARWPERRADWLFLLAVGAAVLLLKLGFVWWVRMEPVSDFAGMWREAEEVAQKGFAHWRETENRTFVWLHRERILTYLLPLGWVFGPSRWSYALPNVFATLACSWLTYRLTWTLFLDRRAARVAYVISLLAVEPILAAGIPTHDLPGALYTLLALALFLHLDRAAVEGRWRALLIRAVGLGVLLVIVDLQRGSRIFLVAAFGVYLVADLFGRLLRASPAEWRTEAVRRIVLALLVPIVVGLAIDAGLHAAGFRMPRDLHRFWQARAIAAHTDSWGSGRQNEAVAEYYQRYDLDAASWRELGRRKLLSDLAYNPEARMANVLRRATSLFGLGSQLNLYVRGATTVRLETLRPTLVGRLSFVNRCFVLAFLALLLLGLASVWAEVALPLRTTLPALYLALLAGALIVLLQPQPRYLFQIWYLGAIYAGGLFRALVPRPPRQT